MDDGLGDFEALVAAWRRGAGPDGLFDGFFRPFNVLATLEVAGRAGEGLAFLLAGEPALLRRPELGGEPFMLCLSLTFEPETEFVTLDDSTIV